MRSASDQSMGTILVRTPGVVCELRNADPRRIPRVLELDVCHALAAYAPPARHRGGARYSSTVTPTGRTNGRALRARGATALAFTCHASQIMLLVYI